MNPVHRLLPLRALVVFGMLGVAAAGLATGVRAARDAQLEDIQIMQGPGGGPGSVMPMGRDATGAPRPAPTGTAIVSGTVVSADAGRPVRRATVRLSSPTSGVPMTVTTNDQGLFRFEKVPAGEFTLRTSKPGYLDSLYGQRRPGSGRPGTPLSITEGQKLERLSLAIARGGVLAGTISDDNGEPAFGADVRALKYVWQNGERTLRPVGADRTDDRGGFRIGALPPGDYIVMATPPSDLNQMNFTAMPMLPPGAIGIVSTLPPPVMNMNSRAAGAPDDAQPSSGYAPVYYPGTTSASGAVAVTLGLSEERAGLDLQTPLLQMGRIRGTVAGDGTRPVAGTEIRLVNLDQALPGLGLRMTVVNQNGQFAFDDVTPGRYKVQAHSGPRSFVMMGPGGPGGGETSVMGFSARSVGPGGPGGPLGFGGPEGRVEDPASQRQLWGTAEVSISGGDTQLLSIVLQPGMSVSGRVAFDGTGQPPADLTGMQVVLNPANQNETGGSSAIGQVAADGRFTIEDVMPGTHRINVFTHDAWRPKSFDVAGKDAMDFMLDVPTDRGISEALLTMTTRSARLSGSILEATGTPGTGYTIVVFAADPTYWTPQSRRIQATRPSTDGHFSLGNLPAGDYRIVALDDLEDGQWFDPAVLRQIASGAIPLTLGDGENKTQDIRVSR